MLIARDYYMGSCIFMPNEKIQCAIKKKKNLIIPALMYKNCKPLTQLHVKIIIIPVKYDDNLRACVRSGRRGGWERGVESASQANAAPHHAFNLRL